MTAKQRKWAVPVILLAMGMVTGGARISLAQEAGTAASPDVYSQEDLLGMEKKLKEKVDASGLATETIKKYSTDYSMLAFRTQSGKAELHEKFADFYVVVDGKATLVSGGKMVRQNHGAGRSARGFHTGWQGNQAEKGRHCSYTRRYPSPVVAEQGR